MGAWYLEQVEEEMEGEADYHKQKALAQMVLKKMVKVRRSLLPCNCSSDANSQP